MKETDHRPRAKAALAGLQEVVSTRVLKITEGDSLGWTPVSVFADRLRGNGLDVTLRRVDQGYLHPHVLVVGRKPLAVH